MVSWRHPTCCCRELPQLRAQIKQMEEEKERLTDKVDKAAAQAAGGPVGGWRCSSWRCIGSCSLEPIILLRQLPTSSFPLCACDIYAVVC